MAVSQQSFYVPWPDNSEWDAVRDQISSLEVNHLIQAYETILIWKLKHFALPAYVESTMGLLQVLIRQHHFKNQISNPSLSILEEEELRMACSTALIRFVNHVSSVSASKGESLYSSAKTQNIPDWIINMRHEAAHSQDLPSLEAIHAALKISLKWLLDNYWMKKTDTKMKKTVQNVSRGNVKALDLFRKAFDILDFCFTKSKKKFSSETRHELLLLLEEFNDIRNQHFNLIKIPRFLNPELVKKTHCNVESNSSDHSNMEVRCVKTAVIKFLETALKKQSNKQFFIKSLIESSFLKGTYLKLHRWKKIFGVIVKAKLLDELVTNLFIMAGEGHEKASKWLTVLYPSIKLLKIKWTMYKVLKKENKGCNYKKIKRQLLAINHNVNGKLLLTLDSVKPPTISLDMMAELLMNPDAHDMEGVMPYLKLVKPSLPKSTIALIKELVQARQTHPSTNSDNLSESDDRIFTVDDLGAAMEGSFDSTFNPDEGEENETDWTKSKIDMQTWNKCSLGLLPFQTKVNCNLPDQLTWVVNSMASRTVGTTQEICCDV